jgi:hypothetical protein
MPRTRLRPGPRWNRQENQRLDAVVVANGFPFGPYFHYIVLPPETIHSWELVMEKHIYAMNLATQRVLVAIRQEGTFKGSRGVMFGLNSGRVKSRV